MYTHLMPKFTKKGKSKKKSSLKGNQKKLDKNHNGRLDAQDFKMMRRGKKGKKKSKK